MANWRLAESLKKLRDQINSEFPDRSKASDGSIGDAAHSARTSDHNPNEAGVVCAIDITSDPRSGCTGDKLAAALIKVRDPRIKYIIWNKRIIKAYKDKGKIPAWTWQKYTGPNSHSHHIHISVAADKKLYDSKAVWKVDFDIAIVQTSAQQKAVEDSDAIQHSEEVAVADSQASQPSVEPLPTQPLPEALNATPAQTNEAGSAGIIIQPNALTAEATLPVVPADEKAIDVQTVVPEKSGAKKSIWATIVAGITFLGLNIQAFFTNAYATVKDNPAVALALIIGCLVVLVIYWKFQERQTKLDELREKQAYELTKLQMELAANQQKYSVNLVRPNQ